MSAVADPEGAFAAALLDPIRRVPDSVRDPERFAVYRNNVVVGLVDAISATYPAVLALVGREFFRAAAREFIRANPPRSPVLIDYGGAFPPWIAAYPPAAALPYLGDVAQLEWAWIRAWHAAEAKPLGVAVLAALPADKLDEARLELHPSLAILTSQHPVVSLWAQTTGRALRSHLDLGRPETALVMRPAERVEVLRLDAAMTRFLNGLRAGLTLGVAAGRAAGQQGYDLARHIADLFAWGLVVRVSKSGSPPFQDRWEQNEQLRYDSNQDRASLVAGHPSR